MQPNNALDYVAQSRRKLNIAGVRNERFIFVGIGVHLRRERVLYLCDIAAEDDEAAAL